MSKKVIFPLIAVFTVGLAAGSLGCQATASGNIGSTEPKAATPPPPPEPTPPPAATPPPADPPPAPPPKPVKSFGKAKIENNEIKIPGKIHFAVDKAAIQENDKETKEILQTVLDVMKENTHITKLRVEGHTDDTGGDDHNNKLSQDRAQAVADWLTKNGVDKGRLDPKGHGSARGLVKNDSKEHKEQNRRVEFKLWELEGKATEAQKNDGAAPAVAGGGAAADPAAVGATPKKDDKKKDDKAGATPAATKK